MSIVVVRTIHLLKSRYRWVAARFSKHIQLVFCLPQNLAPKLEREGFICTAQDRNKVALKSLDGLLSSVSTVIVWRDELVGHIIMLDLMLKLSRTFIIQDVHRWMYVLLV